MAEWKDSHDQYLDEWVSFPYEIKRYQEWLPVYTPFPSEDDVLAQEMFDAIEGKVENYEEYLSQIIYFLGQLTLKLNAIEYYMTKAANQMEAYLDSTKVIEIEQIHGVDASLVIGSTYNDLNNIDTANLTDWYIGGPSIIWSTHALPVTNAWRAICWSPEVGLFAAVSTNGTNNRVLTSPDGINWTNRTSAINNAWYGICWSSDVNLFVAVAYNGSGHKVMTSPDGINWTSRASANDSNYWTSVCWSPDLSIFVAVGARGSGNRVMTSPDGINWTIRTSAADNAWYSVCWSPELTLFVAVAGTGTYRVMTSPNGITWTTRTASAASTWTSVCWSPELTLFVAVSYSNTIMTSSDGITWDARTPPDVNNWRSVCWSPELDLFIAVSSSGGDDVMTSSDGISWSNHSADSNWTSVCWSPGLGLIVGIGTIISLRSTGSSILYEYEGVGWDNDSIITKYISDWDFGKDYLIHPLITFDGTYGIYPNIDIYTKAKTTIEGSKNKISNSEEVLEDYL